MKPRTTTKETNTDNRAAVKAQRRQAGADLKTAKAAKVAAKAKEREAAAAWQKQHGARHGVLLFNKKGTATKAKPKRKKRVTAADPAEWRVTSAEITRRSDKVQRQRGGAARDLDDKRAAKTTYRPPLTEGQMRRWERQPNRYDIVGVDDAKGAKITNPKPKPRRKMSEEEKYSQFMAEARDYNVSKSGYHDDMRAYLIDNRYDEIAPNSRWKWDDKAAAKAYWSLMEDEQKMHYNKKPRRRFWRRKK